MGAPFSLTQFVTGQYKEVAEASSMPRTSDFTLAVFKAEDIPDGMPVYVREGMDFKEVICQLSPTGFTACFRAADVPAGTKIFVKVQ